MTKFIVKNTRELIENIKDIDNIYNIKVKCIAHSYSGWILFRDFKILDNALIVDNTAFPLGLIESIKIRYRDTVLDLKHEEEHIISSNYLKRLFKDEVVEQINEFEQNFKFM